MIIRDRKRIASIKHRLLDSLKKEHAFWSYEQESVILSNIDDSQLIAMTMRHLDLPEIELLFNLYSFKKIKSAWQKQLVPEGDYLYTLNRFFAWYYFKAKHPDRYLKALQTRHFNRMFDTPQDI